jgi:metal-responsive CopG/Arc/MetJ family transcriptional regulator
MQTIQIVLDSQLLRATNLATRRMKSNRSALIRDAIREHLKRLAIQGMEELDRKGYAAASKSAGDAEAWEAEAAWPAE